MQILFLIKRLKNESSSEKLAISYIKMFYFNPHKPFLRSVFVFPLSQALQ